MVQLCYLKLYLALKLFPVVCCYAGWVGHGLKLEKVGLIFSSFNAIWLQKITKKLLRLVLPRENCLIPPF